MFDKVLIVVNGYQITFGTLINCIVVLHLFILCTNLFERLKIMFEGYIICKPEIEWGGFNPYEDGLWSDAEYKDKIDELRYYDKPIDPTPVTVTHATICTQCGHTFQLDKNGTGQCPACGTYYSPTEVK